MSNEIVNPGQTIYLGFETFAKSTGAPITITGLAVGDIKAYKDGGTGERGSTNGYALLDTDGIDFDGITGIHGVSIDLADDSTADFWKSGSQYRIVVSTITVDSEAMSFELARFRIGYEGAILNTFIATLASQTSFTLTDGPAEDDALNGMWAIVHDKASKVQKAIVQISDYTGASKTVTLASGATFTAAAGDNISIMGPMPLQLTSLIDGITFSNGLKWMMSVTIGKCVVTFISGTDYTYDYYSIDGTTILLTTTASLGNRLQPTRS